MQDLIDKLGASVVRTVTPYIVGFVVTFLASRGFDWKPSAGVFVLVSQGVSTAYYALVRYAEEFLSPKFGWLLGKIGVPAYNGAA